MDWKRISDQQPTVNALIMGKNDRGSIWIENHDPEEPVGSMIEWKYPTIEEVAGYLWKLRNNRSGI